MHTPTQTNDASGAGTLYIVATPIGNLGDMSTRAIDTLRTVDIIACEDTRTSDKLLGFFNIPTPTISYHEYNSDSQTARLIALLQSGKSVALISDAGTPLISDPGYRLVKACHDEGIAVVPIVGACALIAALSVSGLPSDKFTFVGFLPAKQHGRIQALTDHKARTETLIFYEAPHRIIDCLIDMVGVFGDAREVALCRELTKTFETVKKAPLGELLRFVEADRNQTRGEIVLVVAGDKNIQSTTDYDAWLIALTKELPPKKACAIIANVLDLKKSTVYDRLLQLQNQ